MALDEYTDRKNDIPAPADVIEILAPPTPRITEAEYIAALRYQERNGYPQFSPEKFIIDDYKAQREGAREAVKAPMIETKSVKAIGNV